MIHHVSTHPNSVFPPFDYSFFYSHVFWLSFFFGLFYWFIASVIAPQISEIFEKRRRTIDADLENAASLKKKIDVLRLKHETRLQEARKHAKEMILVVNRQVRTESKEECLNADHLFALRLTEAANRIASIRDSALQNIEGAAIQIVIEVLYKLTNSFPDKAVVVDAIKVACK